MAIWYLTAKKATWSWAINLSTTVKDKFQLNSITVHFDVAPVTSEDLVVKLNGVDWASYDTILYQINPASSEATDIVFVPDRDLFFEAWDIITATYTNTDWRTYGLRIVTQWL